MLKEARLFVDKANSVEDISTIFLNITRHEVVILALKLEMETCLLYRKCCKRRYC